MSAESTQTGIRTCTPSTVTSMSTPSLSPKQTSQNRASIPTVVATSTQNTKPSFSSNEDSNHYDAIIVGSPALNDDNIVNLSAPDNILTPPRINETNQGHHPINVEASINSIPTMNMDMDIDISRNTASISSKIHPYSTLSPRVAQSYIIERVQSSPSVLDASPKISQRKVSGQSQHSTITHTHGPTQLTPVTRNTNNYSNFFHSNNKSNNIVNISKIKNVSNILCVPEEHSFNKNNVNQIIRPRSISSAVNQNINNNNNNNSFNGTTTMSLRPISPPSRSSLVTTISSSQSMNKPNNNITTTTTAARFDSPPQQSQAVLSSPESNVTPEPRSPPVEESSSPSSLLYIPYQPTRDSSLTSFGISPDELDDIFLPLRRTSNKFRRSSEDKVVLVNGGRGFPSVSSNVDDVDADASTHVSDSQSSTSIPSIRLSSRIHSSSTAQDSYTTFEGIDDDEEEEEEEEDRNYSIATFEDEDEYYTSYTDQDGMQFRSHQQYPDGSATISSGRRKKSQSKKKKEKQVYEWLRALEVDKDNNEYVAEAASSKFLTGKMNNDEQHVFDLDGTRLLYVPERTRSTPQDGQRNNLVLGRLGGLGGLGSLDDCRVITAEKVESHELKTGNSKDSTSISPPNRVKSSATATTKQSKTTNKIVMGRNICAFSGGSTKQNVKSRPSSMKRSGLYR